MIDQFTKLIPTAVSDYLPDALGKLDYAPDALDNLGHWEKMAAKLPGAVTIIVSALVLHWVVIGLLKLTKKFKTRRETDPEAIKRIDTVSRVARYAATVLIYLFAIMLVFDQLGVAVAPLLGAAGIVGIAVGFGAQTLVKDYFTGLFLIIENQLRQGDVVEVGGKSGFVEEVTLRYVRLRDYQGNVHFVPNSLITTVTNMSRGFAFAVLDIGVAYKENTDVCLNLMREVSHEMRNDPAFALKMLEPIEVAGVEALGASAVVLRARIKVPPMEQWTVKREFLRRIKMAFDRAGIEIPFPHLKIYGDAGAGTSMLTAPAAMEIKDASAQDDKAPQQS